MTDPARYGELTGLGLRQVAAGSARLATSRLPDGGGPPAIADYEQVLAALDHHARRVAGLDRHPIADALDNPTTEDDRALRTFLDALTDAASDVRPGAPADGAWYSAARTWNAATDLLATHFGANGDPRSPEATCLDAPAGQAAALSRVAEATAVLLAAGPHLRLRAAQAGMSWAQVEQAVPDLTGLQDAACHAAGQHTAGGWDQYRVARPGLTADGGLRELTGRVRRLRHSAWALSTQPTASVRPLGDIAIAAVTVHQLAAALPGLGEVLAERSRDGAAAWAGVRDGLHHLRTAIPCSNAVRVDAHAIQQLALGLDGGAGLPRRETAETMRTVLDAFTDIAGWNQTALTRMAQRGHLYLRGHYLTGEDITDHPDLVAAKLTDTLATIAPGQLDRLTAAYQRAAAPQRRFDPVVDLPVRRRTETRGPTRTVHQSSG